MTLTYFLLLLVQIVWIDAILSGDNAIVIALACRNLGDNKNLGMTLGAGAAVIFRIACTGAVAWLMSLPYLRICGSMALIYVAIKMLVEEGEDAAPPSGHQALFWAILTIVGADAMMSLDNVVAVAAVANGNFWLMALGLCISIPFVVGGAAVISQFLKRWPVLIWAGGGILGWIAGGMAATDAAVPGVFNETALSVFGAFVVLIMGWFLVFNSNPEVSDA